MGWSLIGQICLKQVSHVKNLLAVAVKSPAKDCANASELTFAVQPCVHVLDIVVDKKVCK